MAEDYSDLSELEDVPEGFQGVEDPGFVPRGNLLDLGWYRSPSRKITFRRKDDDNLTFCIEFGPDPGLQAPDGRVVKYPPRAYLSTTKYLPKGSTTKTSQAAEYLRECGINPQTLRGNEFITAMKDSRTIPLDVKIGAEDDPKDRPTVWKNGKQVPDKARAYSQEFIRDGVLQASIQKDGITLVTKNRVERFRKVRT